MKIFKNITFTIILLLVSNQTIINAQAFLKKEGSATDIAISPKDGSVYVVGTSKNVFKYNTASKKFKPFGKQSKNVKSIAVHSNGSLYMVSTSNEVYIDVNGRWNKIPGIKTNEVDIDKSGNVRALSLSGKLYNLYQGKWQLKSLVNKGTSGFNQLIGKDSKTLFARFKNNNFKQFKSGKWVTLNGSPLKITLDDKTGDVYAVGRNKGVYKWEKAKWVLLENTRKDFNDVAVHNDKIWAVATDKAIYVYDKNKKPKVQEPKDYTGIYRVTFLKFLSSFADFDKTLSGTAGVYLEAETQSGNILIKPLDGKPNRFVDISKSKPIELKKEEYSLKAIRLYKNVDNDLTIESERTITYGFYSEIDKIREFKLIGEAANSKANFDIQFNIRNRNLGIDRGEWVRFKLNLDQIKLNKVYIVRLYESRVSVSFKIEKDKY